MPCRPCTRKPSPAPAPTPTPGRCPSTTSSTRKRCASWWRAARSSCPSRSRSWRRRSTPPTSSIPRRWPRTPSSRRSTIRGSRSAARRSCGSASSRTPSTTSWPASRRTTSSDGQNRPSGGKAPLRRGFFFAGCFTRADLPWQADSAEWNQRSANKKRPWEDTMQRRKFLRSAGIGGGAVVAAGTLAAPAIAQSMPELKWRLTSSFPKSLDTLYGAGEALTKYVAEMTDNKFQMRIFAAGEIVPGLQVLDAVQNGTVEIGHTAGTYYVGKDPTFAFDTAIPFGTNSRQQDAWINWGGGRELLAEFYKAYNVHGIVCGATGAQMGGWFRKEIRTVDDLKGLKFRIAGIAGLVINRVGGVAQQIAGGDIYPALEKGTIDAAEWVGPYDDQKLGFNKIAPYYYYPGWWEGGTANHIMINAKKWAELPKTYQAIATAAAAYANTDEQAKYDSRNPAALRRLVANGTQLRPFSQSIMEACYKAANEVYAETTAKNPDFKKVWEDIVAFRNEEYLWWQVAEYTYDSFMIRMRARS